MKVAAIIAAAGAGLRMLSETRKQYMRLEGMPVLVRSVKLFCDRPDFETVAVVIPAGDEAEVRALLEPFCSSERLLFVEGGQTRQVSVSKGLKALPPSAGLVCIHDAARPLASVVLLEKLLAAAAEYGAAVPVIPLNDTLKEIDPEGFITATLPRDKLRLVQTPQVFRRAIIEKAYREAFANATDDASLVELAGFVVRTVPGELTNFKITTPLDIALAALLLKGEIDG
ncbi:MAG: 2-C-methyl-D-erythritol 4-phosphate cytidylyltransferase [Bacillota bacterium]|nr:2-C-methyl-D-erythritol 4-phosphate cytidylyltransferase [Bacillota bacterium]